MTLNRPPHCAEMQAHTRANQEAKEAEARKPLELQERLTVATERIADALEMLAKNSERPVRLGPMPSSFLPAQTIGGSAEGVAVLESAARQAPKEK